MYIIAMILLVLIAISLGYYVMFLQEEIEVLEETILILARERLETEGIKEPLDRDANDNEMW